ncbi:MAG: tetratricopeptide repeat protein [Phycisphaeraceae bacterium]
MRFSPPLRALAAVLALLALAAAAPAEAHAAHSANQSQPPAPEPADEADERPSLRDQIQLAPLVQRLLEDELTDDAERRRLRVFHGQWDAIDDDAALPIEERARLALFQYRLRDAAFQNEETDPLLRAEAALRRGEPERAVALLDPADSAQAALLCAEAHEQLGQFDRAVAALQPWRDRLQHEDETFDRAAELTAAARGTVMLARLEGRPAHEYQFAMNQLGRAHQALDPLYWPARLAEAEILVTKDNAREALEALEETLSLNPNSSEAWYRLGRFFAERFDFDRAEGALDELRAINERHLLADLLEAHIRLQQRDPGAAREVLADAAERYPTERRIAALQPAVEALAYDEEAMQRAFERHDRLAPGNAKALYITGAYLSVARQYELAEQVLRAAIERQPNWPMPHIELGLLLMQSGDDEGARAALRRATRLDPFNRRANNQLDLVEALLDYERIETEHFVIRHRPGIDAVLARDMAANLEQMYRDVTSAFEHEPARKTHIDIMPDEEWFGVRITGMPDIWTIAAATGDVISLTPPRAGAKQRGTYDWLNVIRHEFVHTVTLSRTKNRLPHWFTEACAVSQELTGRDYQTAQLLAWALHEDELFTLDNINWGFIRPETPRDRPLAYAQAHWMLEFITHSAGHNAVIEMLDRYSEGESNVAAVEAVTGYTNEQFMQRFRDWAQRQVREWGLTPPPDDSEVRSVLQADGGSMDMKELRDLATRHDEHPALLRVLAQRAVETGDAETAWRAVNRYAAARPLDPWAHRKLAQLALQTGRQREAAAALSELDRRATRSGAWARQLANLHRQADRLDAAAGAAARALRREPYNASYRELAATIALQRGAPVDALPHVRALTRLEPKRAHHYVRLAALYAMLDEPERMRAAAEEARELDQEAPVERFLQ